MSLFTRSTSSNLADRLNDHAPDMNVVKGKVLEAVEELFDRATSKMQDAPTPRQAASRVQQQVADTAQATKKSKAAETVAAVAVAAAPVVLDAVRARLASRNARRAAVLVPMAAKRSSPLAWGAVTLGGAALGAYMSHRKRVAARQAKVDAAHHTTHATTTAAQHDRMDGEGGTPGSWDGAPVSLVHERGQG